MQFETNTLTRQQRKDIEELITLCNKTDDLHGSAFLEQELNYYPEFPCFFFYYKQKYLVSFLSLFFPSSEEVEVSAYTHPDYRQQRYFSSLFQQALSFLSSSPIKRTLFITEPHCISSEKALSSLHAKYLYSDHFMTLPKYSPYTVNSCDFSLKPAKKKDLPTLSAIHAEAFDTQEEVSKEFISDILCQHSAFCYKFLLKDTIIGLCSVQLNTSSICLFGVCIEKNFQSHGYGAIMLELLLNDLLSLGKPITLQVNSLDRPALHLYQKLGFSSTLCFNSYYIEN